MNTTHVLASLAFCLVLWPGDAVRAVEEDQPAEENLAENQWPIGFKLPDEVIEGWKRWEKASRQSKAHILVWTPPEAERVRAVYLIPNNTDSKNAAMHDRVREVCAKQEVGIVYLRYFAGHIIERSDPPKTADEDFTTMLDMVAERTGIEEYRYAPWITFGKSSRGRFPFRTTWWFPERVVTSISYHGETPSWPMASWSKVADESVLHLAVNGEQEWDGTWYRHVRPSLLNYHLNTNWLGHQVVLHGVGHGNYVDVHGSKGWGKPVPEGTMSVRRVWDYIALHIDQAMQLRVPEGVYATADEPVELKQIDRASGWLIHPRAPEELLKLKWHAFRRDDDRYEIIPWPEEKSPVHAPEDGDIDRDLLIRKAADVPEEERPHYLWIPTRKQLEAWLDLHNPHGLAEGLLPEG